MAKGEWVVVYVGSGQRKGGWVEALLPSSGVSRDKKRIQRTKEWRAAAARRRKGRSCGQIRQTRDHGSQLRLTVLSALDEGRMVNPRTINTTTNSFVSLGAIVVMTMQKFSLDPP